MGYFSDQEMNRRLANLRHAMDNQSVEAVLITSVHNTLYYSNFWMIPWGREQGLVIPRENEPAAIAPHIEYDRPAKMVGDGSKFRDIRIYTDNASAIDGWVGLARQVLLDRGITSGRIGIEEDNVSITMHKALCTALPDLEFVEMGYAMMCEQMLKSDEEIALIRAGAEICDLGAQAFVDAVHDGVTEVQVARATHLGETKDENDYCQARLGMRPLDYLDQCGWLQARTWLAHGIHFSDSEITRLGQAGVAVSHCPHSNMLLSSGLCPACSLEQAGSPVGLGVDGSASNDASNAIEEVRAALMLQRFNSGSAAVSHTDALRWATAGGARCLGRDDLGRIDSGLQADIALFKLDELRHSGHDDPLAALVQCGAHRADRVMIAGQWQVENGRASHIDEVDLVARHSALARRLRNRAGLE